MPLTSVPSKLRQVTTRDLGRPSGSRLAIASAVAGAGVAGGEIEDRRDCPANPRPTGITSSCCESGEKG